MAQRASQIVVVCPVRNEETFVERMILSLREQSFTDWTAVFMDNSSTDETVSLINHYAESDHRIYLVTRPEPVEIHRNFSDVFDFAYSNFDFHFIQLVAADDLLGDEDYFKNALHEMATSGADFAIGRIEHFDETGVLEVDQFEELTPLSRQERIREFSFSYWKCNAIYSFFRKDFFDALRQQDLYRFTSNLSSDWWLSLGAHLEGQGCFSSSLTYRKFRKQLKYTDSHYSATPTRSTSRLREWVSSPYSRLGDRRHSMSWPRSVIFLLLFTFADLVALSKNLSRARR